MFYYFECSTPEVKNWLKKAKEFGWDVGDYTTNNAEYVLYIKPDSNLIQSAWANKDGYKLSLKELMELIVNKKVPEPPKLYFKDLKVGDKFYFNDKTVGNNTRIKCRGTGRLLNCDVYIHQDTYEIEELYGEYFANIEVIKITD